MSLKQDAESFLGEEVSESKTVISHSDIEAVAPDQASLNTARKLLQAPKWPLLLQDRERTLLWGSCQGSGATPYSVTVARADLGAKCTCPSRKFPCKHALALMWWYADQPELFSEGEVPEWVSQWLSRRRGSAAKPKVDSKTQPAKSVVDALSLQDKPKDTQRAARQSERVRKAREQSVRRGLDELDLWILDQVEAGLGNFAARATEQCRLMSQRLVDAKAGGLAALVEALPGRYFSALETARADMLIDKLGKMHLLSAAYRRQQSLPTALQSDVRSLVGWSVSRDELLSSADALRISGDWIAVANRTITQADRLLRQETWLLNEAQDAQQRFAVLLDFVPAAMAASAAPAVTAGTRLQAEMVFYPSATPLRALVAHQEAVSKAEVLPDFFEATASVYRRYLDAIVLNPWLGSVPVEVAAGVVKQDVQQGLWLEFGEEAIRIQNTVAKALLGAQTVRACALFDGKELFLLAVHSELGTWWSVPQ